MTKEWEHVVSSFDRHATDFTLQNRLDFFGQQGFELVAVTNVELKITIFLKRVKPGSDFLDQAMGGGGRFKETQQG